MLGPGGAGQDYPIEMFTSRNMWPAVYSRGVQKDIFTVSLLSSTAQSGERGRNSLHFTDALFTAPGRRQRGSSLKQRWRKPTPYPFYVSSLKCVALGSG